MFDVHVWTIAFLIYLDHSGSRSPTIEPRSKILSLRIRISFGPEAASMHLGQMSSIFNLFPSFFGKNPTPHFIDLPREETPAMYPWSLHHLHLPPIVRSNNSWPGPLPQSPFPRYGHSVSASTVSHGDLYLFGGLVDGLLRNDLYLFRTSFNDSNDGKSLNNESEPPSISASLFETGGEIPSPRVDHAGAIVSSVLIIWGGQTNINTEQTSGPESQSTLSMSPASMSKPETLDDGLYLLNLGANRTLIFVAMIAGVDPFREHSISVRQVDTDYYPGPSPECTLWACGSHDRHVVLRVWRPGRWDFLQRYMGV